ncbi:hypothetical protein ACLMJK_004875 [Lecanora helva]
MFTSMAFWYDFLADSLTPRADEDMKSCVALASTVLSTFFRIPQYEIFSKSHFAIAVFAACTVWRHLMSRSSKVYIVVAASLFSITALIRYGRLVLRNVTWGRPFATTRLTRVKDAMRVQIAVSRPWEIQAGDFIYLWMPGVSFWSCAQSHPFVVSWWDQNVDGKAGNIYLLVKPQAGFTQKLLRHAGSESLRAWVDGPYGRAIGIGDYGSVLMFATGIGITAQVPYVKQLLKGFQSYRVRTKSILLVWQLDNESDQEWVQEWMSELLSEDKGAYILRIRLYVLRNFEDKTTSYGDKEDYGEHERIKKLYGKPHLEKLIEREVENRRGRLMITSKLEQSK